MRTLSRLAAVLLLSMSVSGSDTGRLPQKAAASHASYLLPAAVPADPISSAFSSFSTNYVSQAGNLRHWGKSEVTIRLYQKPTTERAASFERGLDLWNRDIGSIVHLTLTDVPTADVAVDFVRPGTLPGGAIGLTQVAYRQEDQTLLRAEVRINDNLAGDALTQVVAHEMGHVLGISGHSPDPHDVMFLHSHLPAAVSARDLNTMVLSYGASALGMPLDSGDDSLSDR